ncbi:MAG: prolyl oligopeptidase family serine peptidase [bacterium]|nr:prolyl oligopeptidase family serine peptidase [bacterium]
MRLILMRSVSILLLVFLSNPLFPGELKKLSLKQVIRFEGEQLTAPLPNITGWFDDTHYLERKEGKLYKVSAKNGKASIFKPKEETRISIINAAKSSGTAKLGDSNPQNPTPSPDGTKLAYTTGGNLYVYDSSGGKTLQLTKDGSKNILNGYASWVYYEEILGRMSRYKAFWWSPDGSRLVFMRFDQSQVPEFPIFRSAGDYGDLERTRYPKAGYPNPSVKIGIAHLKDNRIQWIDFRDEGDHYLAFPTWNQTGDSVFFQWVNRGQDHIKILRFHLGSGEIQTVYDEKQKTWVEFFSRGDLYVLKNNELLVRSSKDGWLHIYHISSQGKERQVTSGDWSVTSIQSVDEKKKRIYFNGRKEASTETDFYRTGYQGGKITRLTGAKGTHRTILSPGGSYFIDTYSTFDAPMRMELRDNRGRLVRKLGDSYSSTVKKYEISKVKTELFRIKTDDGYALPALWYLPPDFDKTKKYPVVITVYGGPDSAVVANSFSGGYRNGLMKFYLAQEGIINLFVDNRGSSHFGKKGMDLMHRQLGKWEMYDYIQAVKYLRTLPFIDSQKIGISGHSYGGYVAALALTYGSDYFKYGFSGSPVIHWKLYDTVYTERFMDTPQENPEGYKESSPLNYIDKYKDGTLRMTHGSMDDNVHMQNAIQFVDKLLETGKTMELMIYPGSRHGVGFKHRFEYMKSNLNFWLKNFFGRTVE